VYVRENVAIDAEVTALSDILLTRITNKELLPPTPEVMAQMTRVEWLASLSGSGDEKKLLTTNCNWCHSYQQIFRNRYDEAGRRAARTGGVRQGSRLLLRAGRAAHGQCPGVPRAARGPCGASRDSPDPGPSRRPGVGRGEVEPERLRPRPVHRGVFRHSMERY